MNNLVACKFAIEDGQTFEGFYNPDNKYWNGWLNPYVNAETHDKICSYFMDGLDSMPADDDAYDDVEALVNMKPDANGLYFVGMGWIWAEVK